MKIPVAVCRGNLRPELIKHLIGGPDLTLVEHSHAPFRTGPLSTDTPI
jgi:hypothetical protein